MIIIGSILIWLAFIVVNIFFAKWNVGIVHYRQKVGNTKQINHPLWAAFYSIVCGSQWFVFHNWYFMVAILLLHISVFPVAYNRDMGLPAFNLSKTSKAVTDRLQVKAGLKTSAAVNIVAFMISIALLIISIIK